MNEISDSVRIQTDVAACEECGSASRIGRGLCLNCLLHRCLGANSGTPETLYEALNEVDVRDADWRIGNYQILEEIGRGGMGVIYRARQRHSRRIVAVKRVLSYHGDSRETLVRFRREAEAAASLDHPNILPIYEVSESEDGLPFFSMKFAPGGSLQEAGPTLRNNPRRSVALMAKVARAVQYAHVQGILHRDLKPGNVLLDGRGEPLVSDFGLAKWLDASSDVTRTLTIFGTPGYIAPEQARGPAAKPHTSSRCLQSRRDLVRSFHRTPAISGRARAGCHSASVRKTCAEVAFDHFGIRSRFRDNLREMFGT
jgi:serine/threonine protein kinase